MTKQVAPIVAFFNDDGSVHSLARDGQGVSGPLQNIGATAPTLAGMQSAFNDGSAAEKSAFQASVSGDRLIFSGATARAKFNALGAKKIGFNCFVDQYVST